MKVLENLEQEKILEMIEKLPFFFRFSSYEKKRLVAFNTNFLVFEEGERIISEGELSNEFYILITGQAAVIKDGTNKPIAIVKRGDFLGEVAFLTGRPRTVGVLAVGKVPVVVLKVDKIMLGQISAEIREKFKDQIIEQLIERIDRMNERNLELTSRLQK